MAKKDRGGCVLPIPGVVWSAMLQRVGHRAQRRLARQLRRVRPAQKSDDATHARPSYRDGFVVGLARVAPKPRNAFRSRSKRILSVEDVRLVIRGGQKDAEGVHGQSWPCTRRSELQLRCAVVRS